MGGGDEFLWPSASAVNREGVWTCVRITACVTPVLLQHCREFSFANECEPFISSAAGRCLCSVIYSGENRGKLLIITAAVGEEEMIFTYFCHTEPHKNNNNTWACLCVATEAKLSVLLVIATL